MSDELGYKTPRGFIGYLHMTDTYGSTVRVQQSSAAFDARCWLLVEASKDGHPGALTADGAAHLSRCRRLGRSWLHSVSGLRGRKLRLLRETTMYSR